MIKERFVVTSGINGTELLRSLAAQGRDSFGLRIITPVELARLALARSGVGMTDELITADGETALVIAAFSGNGYYNESSFADASAVAASLGRLRRCITQDEPESVRRLLEAGEFKSKNAALLKIYEGYMSLLAENGLTDGVGLIRSAVKRARPIEAEFITLAETPLMPLEQALVGALSRGTVICTDIAGLLGKKRVPPMIADITNAYGASNEAEHILNDILESGVPLDSCVVAVADTARYSQLFLDMAERFGLPVTFGCGVPVMNANPGKLLSLIYEWNGPGMHGKDALSAVINSDAFDLNVLKEYIGADVRQLADTAGELRLSMDSAENAEKLARFRAHAGDAAAEPVTALAGELEKGYAYLIAKYALIRRGSTLQGKIDRSAVRVLGETLRSFARFGNEADIRKLIPSLLRKTVSSENSREGFLHITSIGGARAVLRGRLYVAGLSAGNFPGSPREDPILLDGDYAPLTGTVGADALPTSENLTEQNRRALFELAGVFSALGTAARLSYPGYDVCELKEDNPSAALFELYQNSRAGAAFDDYMASMKRAGYFEKTLSPEHGIGGAYARGMAFAAPPERAPETPCGCSVARAFSPSAIETFFECPRRFFLKHVLGVRPEETDDPSVWMDPKQFGNLAHHVMERSANRGLSRNEFMALAEKELNEFEAIRPPASDNSRQRAEFLSMMEQAYANDPGNEVLLSEKTLTAAHPSGITLTGKPDRLEKTPGGEYVVVDYKTGALITHTANDVDSCLQTLIYAFMLEQNGMHITRCEYRYMRYGRTVVCKNSADMQTAVTDRLQRFAAALPAIGVCYPENGGNCTYCDYNGCCGMEAHNG